MYHAVIGSSASPAVWPMGEGLGIGLEYLHSTGTLPGLLLVTGSHFVLHAVLLDCCAFGAQPLGAQCTVHLAWHGLSIIILLNINTPFRFGPSDPLGCCAHRTMLWWHAGEKVLK